MSTYYSFYIGYKTKDKKFHAYGPFDKFNKLCPVLEKSRSFISDIYRDFYPVHVESMDDFLKEKFTYKSLYKDNDEILSELYYLPVSELGSTDYLKSGYIDIDEIDEFEKSEDKYFYYFESIYDPTKYARELELAVRNNNQERIDELKRMVFYMYPDYSSKEYDNFLLSNAISYNGMFSSFEIEDSLKKNNEELDEIVILMSIS